MTNSIKLAIILPCYNEEEALEESFSKLNKYFISLINEKLITKKSIFCFVDDGSVDKTWNIIEKLRSTHQNINGIKLSRNFGQQNALLAGLTILHDQYDCYITLDVDLQDDITTIEKMLFEYNNGNSIVYGVRDDRSTDSFFKRISAIFFYKVMNFLGVETIHNHAEFRLLDNNSLTELLQFKEVNFFLRGIVPLLGFNTSKVYYNRFERKAGETKYPLSKMISLAWDGISSFSIKPMRFVLIIGFITFLSSIIISLWIIYIYLGGLSIPGWFSTLFPLLLLSGIQMMSIGLLGEYIGKVFLEIKQRPRFIIEKYINNELA